MSFAVTKPPMVVRRLISEGNAVRPACATKAALVSPTAAMVTPRVPVRSALTSACRPAVVILILSPGICAL